MTKKQQAIADAVRSVIVWERLLMSDFYNGLDTKTSREAVEQYRKELKELGIDLDTK